MDELKNLKETLQSLEDMQELWSRVYVRRECESEQEEEIIEDMFDKFEETLEHFTDITYKRLKKKELELISK